ncbi:predicted protein [Histoplasma mississippiense (nom. inval.)]|uniref:predicted protein n=1 Tax=Ajellomyces capsulatus (strain NAm1 / WU24) TaxID=2059318 RepID=UPI000157CC23|nr:predicted protein [Histoplasma mississippiense (nom. inval.)]EDN10292.1 predicted protein [Histoplasma mississippiense (nom. inval.)]
MSNIIGIMSLIKIVPLNYSQYPFYQGSRFSQGRKISTTRLCPMHFNKNREFDHNPMGNRESSIT